LSVATRETGAEALPEASVATVTSVALSLRAFFSAFLASPN
jgi:hypothetical protein